MARREPKILTDVPRMARRDPRNAPLKADLRDRRGGQGDDTKWLPKAARTALESAALDGLLRSSASLAARGLGRIAPVFVGPGKGMRPASAEVADGVYVPRAAAERVGDTADLERFDAMLAGRDFRSLPRAERVAIAKETGWQQLPTGETVRQLPKFEFAKGAWRGAERFATPVRNRLSRLAGESPADLPDLELGEALAGPGAERFFGYYPEAKRWLFRTDDLPTGVLGHVGTGSRMSTLSGEALADGPATVANALHHEVQHVVQDTSRLPLGSSSADAYGELNQAMFRAVAAGKSLNPAVRTGARALVTADGMGNPARYAYMHTGGEAGAYAVGNTATEGPAALLTDAMTREGITPGNVYDLAAIRAVSQDAKGGSSESAPDPRGRASAVSSPRPGGEAPSDRFSMSRNFLATDKVPETIFGIPIVSRKEDYTEADIEFFRQHPEAGGYYDLGEETPEAVGQKDVPTQAAKGGDAHTGTEVGRTDGWSWDTYQWNPEAPGGKPIDPRDIKGTGISFDAAQERMKLPKGREAAFAAWMDGLVNLPTEIEVEGRKVPIRSSLVPKDWRTNTEYNRDYDYVAAFLAGAKPGPLDHGPKEGWYWHMGDAGKMPSHPTFSKESYYARDPRYAALAGDWAGEIYLPGPAEREARFPPGHPSDDAYATRVEAALTSAEPFVASHEGFRSKAYRDPTGKWTVGYGQTEIDGRPVREGDTITDEAASAFVRRRLRENAAALSRQNPWTRNLSTGALAALYDAAYNLGTRAFDTERSPNLNAEMESADMDYDAILWRELPTYVSAGGKRLKGLVNRRADAERTWRRR